MSNGVRIIERYVLIELLKSFAAAVVVVTALMTLVTGVLFLQRHMVSALLTLMASPYLMALQMWLVLPFSFLLASALTYHRMSAQNEVLAVEMSGMSLVRVFAPGVLLGLAVSLAALGFNGYLQPWAKGRLRTMAYDNMAQIVMNALKRKRSFSKGKIWFTWKRYTPPNTIHEVSFLKMKKDGGYEMTQYAEKAKVSVTRDGRNLRCILYQSSGQFKNARITSENIEFLTSLAEQRAVDLQEFTTPAVYDEIAKLKLNIAKQRWREEFTARMMEKHTRALEPMRWSHFEKSSTDAGNQARQMERDLAEARTEIWARDTLSLMPLVFGLVGIPLAVALRRAHMLVAFAIALAVAFVFYLSPFLALRILAEGGRVWPGLMELVNVLVGLAGLAFMMILAGLAHFVRMARRQ